MSSYSIILAPMGGILAADYLFVKHGRIDVPELYNKPGGLYRFDAGFNWRAAIALVCAIAPNMPGMIASINSNIDIGGARYVYYVADIFGIVVGGGVHVALHYISPDARSNIDYSLSADDVIDNLTQEQEVGMPKAFDGEDVKSEY